MRQPNTRCKPTSPERLRLYGRTGQLGVDRGPFKVVWIRLPDGVRRRRRVPTARSNSYAPER
jgi:hypothetical protein